MNKLKYLILPLVIATASSCHHIDEWDGNAAGNFDALWTAVDQHYCFFEQKGVDWDSVRAVYRPQALKCHTVFELYEVCSAMLNSLRDGHVNLITPFSTSYYRNWWSDYPQNYNQRLIEEHYMHFNFYSTGGIDYYITPENIGYMHYSSFSYGISESALDYIFTIFADCDGLIIDIRDNGGGTVTNVETLARRFIDNRILAGYISHKTGPGHNDFSEPYAYYYDPAPAGRLRWTKPVAVLTNRSTFSAANNFASVMKGIDNVRLVGATTGGGSGMPFSSEIPIGWSVRFSACSVLDAAGNSTENGVEPSPGCAVDMDLQQALNGHDTILDFAIDLLKSK